MELAKSLTRVKMEAAEEQYRLQSRQAALERELVVVKEHCSRTQVALQTQVGHLQEENTRLAWKLKDDTTDMMNSEIDDQRALRRATQQERERLEVMLSVVAMERDAARGNVGRLEAQAKEVCAEAESRKGEHEAALEKSRGEWDDMLAGLEEDFAKEREILREKLEGAEAKANRQLDELHRAESRCEELERDSFTELMELREALKDEQLGSAALRQQVADLEDEAEELRRGGSVGGVGGGVNEMEGMAGGGLDEWGQMEDELGRPDASMLYRDGNAGMEGGGEDWMAIAEQRQNALLVSQNWGHDQVSVCFEWFVGCSVQ